MLEKEIKILEIDEKKVVQQLEQLGAAKIFEGVIHDVYYDIEDNGEHKLDANGRIFRIRKKGEETHLYTIKRKRKKLSKKTGLKVMEEREHQVTDVESFEKVVEQYGLTKVREKIKHRVSYVLHKGEAEEVQFDIDMYEGIPVLLEIEAHGEEVIEKYITILGLENHKKKKFGSRGLFKHYNVPYNYIENKKK